MWPFVHFVLKINAAAYWYSTKKLSPVVIMLHLVIIFTIVNATINSLLIAKNQKPIALVVYMLNGAPL